MIGEFRMATPEDLEAINAGLIPIDDQPASASAEAAPAQEVAGADPVAAAFEKAAAEPYAELLPNSPVKATKPGKVDATADRMKDDPELDSIVFNVVRWAPFLRGPVPWDKDGRERLWSDVDESHLLAYMQTVHGFSGGKGILRDALTVLAYQRQYDPLKEALDSLPEWDGTERVGHMLQWYLGVSQDTDPYGREVERLVYDAIVRRVYEPGCTFQYMAVLMGPQGIGKSTFLARLAINDEFFTDNLPPFGNKEFPMVLQGRLIAEVSELSSMKASSSEIVKGTITRVIDTYRVPYDRHPIDQPRRCIFIGTTNNERYLVDETGNRRFLPITCATVKPTRSLFAEDVHAEFEQALAEAVTSYKAGRARKELLLSQDVRQEAGEAQAEAFLEDPRVEQIGQWLETAPRRVCLTQICREALGISGKIDRYEADRVRTIMEKHFSDTWAYMGSKKARIANYGTARYYERLDE